MYSCKTADIGSCLSGSDAISLLEFIHRSLSCNTEEDFTALFPMIQGFLPFDFATSLLGCLENNDVVIAQSVNISFPDEWLCEYSARNYIKDDSIVKQNFRAYRIQDWSTATKEKINEPKEITLLCKDFGMKSGYMHGSSPQPPEKYGSMFCFSSGSLKYDERNEAILELITPHLHLALTRIFNKKRKAINGAVLSGREKEVMDWLKRGKSSWDISVILGISERTVNFHVGNIMRKLGVSKRQQAVAVAVHRGLIGID